MVYVSFIHNEGECGFYFVRWPLVKKRSNIFICLCRWCQRLHPTWEKFAEEVDAEGMPVGVANVDCVSQIDVCRKESIQAFPTLRWYEEGQFQQPPYKSDRTVSAFVSFAQRKLELNAKFKDWSKKSDGKTKEEYRQLYNVAENPGCQVSGTLMGKFTTAILMFLLFRIDHPYSCQPTLHMIFQ